MLVLVTGASGFIATHVVKQLLERGHNVRGTVRSLANEDKVKPLRNMCPGAKYDLELMEADLTSDAGWVDAVRGCDYVIHMASPFPDGNPKDEDEVIKPSVDGTLRVLRACREVGGVNRVVLTSSVGAIGNGFEVGGAFTEEDWTDPDNTTVTLNKSKTLAERAAWDFVASLPDENKFDLTVLNPAYTVGPVLCGGWATSLGLVQRMVERKIPALPKMNFSYIDVRDVATAHVIALTAPQAAGKRIILAAGNLWMKEMATILAKEFDPLGYNVPTTLVPHFLAKIAAATDASLRMVLPAWGKVTLYDNTRMATVLGIQPRPLPDALIEMAHSMIEKGFIKKTDKYKRIKEKAKSSV